MTTNDDVKSVEDVEGVDVGSQVEGGSYNEESPSALQVSKLPPRYDFGLPNKVGRPPLPQTTRRRTSKFDDLKIRQKAIAASGVGASVGTVARYVGIGPTALRNWLERGRLAGSSAEGADRDYYEFYIAYEQADATLEVGSITTLISIARGMAEEGKDASPKDPKILQWLLERVYPDRYGKRTKVEGSIDHRHLHEHRGSVGVNITTYEDVPDEKLDEMIKTARELDVKKRGVIDAEIVED